MSQPVPARVRKRLEALRAQGLSPAQIWVPDARRPGFDAECRRQSRVVAAADFGDRELLDFLGEAAAETQDDGAA